MGIEFQPKFTITTGIALGLMRIEAVRQAILTLPITPRVLKHLRETARLYSTHYSTQIEGNRLTQAQVELVIGDGQHFPGRERDEDEVRGYYAALDALERLAEGAKSFEETDVRRLHTLVMGGGKTRVKPTAYRDGQNVIRDSGTGAIVYLPPTAEDVPGLMAGLVSWVHASHELPMPLKAAIAHYQFATIHPYYDGNGRTGRLLTTLILHQGGYGLKGLYALEEYYARDLGAYYEALTVGPSHNYYLGRAEAEITRWVAYFIEGMAAAFEKVRDEAVREAGLGGVDRSRGMRNLDARQRRVLTLFEDAREVTTKEVAVLFGFTQQSASLLCRRWAVEGFLVVADAAKKTRRYRLADAYEATVRGSE